MTHKVWVFLDFAYTRIRIPYRLNVQKYCLQICWLCFSNIFTFGFQVKWNTTPFLVLLICSCLVLFYYKRKLVYYRILQFHCLHILCRLLFHSNFHLRHKICVNKYLKDLECLLIQEINILDMLLRKYFLADWSIYQT